MVTRRSLFSWIFRGQWPFQILLLVLILGSIFFRVLPLELQKRIINTAIGLKMTDLLFIYCALYLGAVILFSSLKYAINMLETYIGQKILLQMRNALYEHILSLPLQFFRRTQPGTVMTSLTGELNAVGFFLGGALAIPVTSVLTLLAFAGYMISLSPRLALISLAVYPAEVIIIPFLQNRYNRLNSIRVDETRDLSNAINEAISGIHEIQGNASYRVELERFGKFADRLFFLLNRLFQYRFGTKFVNNFFQNLGPFFLFLVGGYLTIQGEFTLGALVAFLSAFEKVYDPGKELIEYYQDYQDARVRYQRVMECFDVEPEFALRAVGRPLHRLRGEIEVKDLEYKLESGVHLLDDISFHLSPGEHMAVVGFSGSGKSTLAMVLGQLYRYDRGQVLLDGHDVRQLSKADVSANIGFVAQHPFIFNGTVRDNILYGRRALALAEGGGGNWTLPEREEVLAMLRTVGLEQDVIRFGLNTVIPPERCEPLAGSFTSMRYRICEVFGEKLGEVVELYDVNNFLKYASIYDNLLFSDAFDPDYLPANLPYNRTFLRFLAEEGLDELLVSLGKELAVQSVALVKDMEGKGNSSLEQTPMKSEQLETYKMIVDRVASGGKVGRKDQALLLSLSFGFVPALHKIASIPQSLEEKIVQARHRFIREIVGMDIAVCTLQTEGIDGIEEHQTGRPDFSPYCWAKYQYSHTLLENLIYGNVREEQTAAMAELVEQVTELLTKENLLDEVLDAGLDFEVGSKGDRLSGGQRQKIALARAFLKDTPVLIMDEATASLDNASQGHIQRYLETTLKGKRTVVAVMHRLDMVPSYDQVLVLRVGRVVESGRYETLMKQRGVFYELATGNR